MRVNLADDAEAYVKVKIERFEGNVCAERAIFPFMPKGVRSQSSISGLLHKYNRVEDAWDGSGGEDRRPNHTVRGSEIIRQDSRRVRIRWHA